MTVLVYAGHRPHPQRFPTSAQARVARHIQGVLDEFRPTHTVGGAAAGADLLLLESSLSRGIPALALMPVDLERYRMVSVASVGSRWAKTFDHIVKSDLFTASHPTHVVGEVDRELFRQSNRNIVEAACVMASTCGQQVTGLVVRSSPFGSTVTDDFAKRLEVLGISFVEVDCGGSLNASDG